MIFRNFFHMLKENIHDIELDLEFKSKTNLNFHSSHLKHLPLIICVGNWKIIRIIYEKKFEFQINFFYIYFLSHVIVVPVEVSNLVAFRK